MGESAENVWKLLLIILWTFSAFYTYNELMVQQNLDVSNYGSFQTFGNRTRSTKSKDMTQDEIILKSMGTRDTIAALKTNESTVYLQPYPLDVKLKYGLNRFIVIMVTTMAESIERRNLIRKSWYKWSENFDCRVLFFVGVPKLQSIEVIKNLEKENELYGDIIVDDFEESYYRLTSKVLRMMKWFLSAYGRHQNIPKYFLKMDHDVFIHIPNLIAHLRPIKLSSNSSINYYIGGYLHKSSPLVKDLKSKFFLSPDFWLDGKVHYPSYLGGPCYVLSGNIVEAVYKASFSTPLFPFEDVYVTGIIANEILNLTLSAIPNFVIFSTDVQSLIEKGTTENIIALHPMEPPGKMSWLYSKIMGAL